MREVMRSTIRTRFLKYLFSKTLWDKTRYEISINSTFVGMKKAFTCILFSAITIFSSFATHNRAGEITFRHLSGLTYEFTITTFTYSLSAANRSELTIEWGDNTASVAPLIQRNTLPNYYYHNIYTATHTFPGPGIYNVLVQDPNRNVGVQNIPNSVNVVFSITTTLVINSFIGFNNSPDLLNPPKDRAALGHIFIHNPSAYDPDGDSLSYKLTVCTGQNGNPINGYSLPNASDTLYVDPVSGDLVWNAPTDTGKYNIAMNIEEWRNGVKIGNIVRDMQIEVFKTDNNPPVNPESMEFCVEAGDLIEFTLTTTDVDDDQVGQQMTGGPLILQKDSASFTKDTSGFGFSTSTFRWQTTCDHVRKQPYQMVLKSEDIVSDISLVDIDNYYIRVIAPAPEGLVALPTSAEIALHWNRSACSKADKYALYRREGRYDFNPDSCENGVPEYTGYRKIAEVTDTAFIDGHGIEGLVQGIEYCYVITALFPDGAESYASEPFCVSLIPGLPALTHVSVLSDDAANGEIYLAWAKPRNLDTLVAPGPYVYQIYRSDLVETNMTILDSIMSADLSDTTYIDSPVNTLAFPYYYSVKIINNTPGNRFAIGEGFTEIASSLYIDITPDDNQLTLNFRKKVPWVNTEYMLYRQNSATLDYDSIGTTTNDVFVDENLENGTEYCYRVISRGWRPYDSLIYTNENTSHINCAIPRDLTPPCPPALSVISLCDSAVNLLTWTNPNNSCSNDVVRYNIYFSNDLNAVMDSIASTFSPVDTVYRHHIPETQQLAGCYTVTAVDSFENESMPSEKICLDECYLYEFPNVFTPNGDNINDKFKAYNLNNAVKKIDLKIFNRWGKLVYESTDPNFEWDGKILNTDSPATAGVYYYVCDVYEPRLTGIFIHNIVGFVHIFTEPGEQAKPPSEK